ncbi:MAG TPA: serine hydrolase [Flavisolibacter sp.]
MRCATFLIYLMLITTGAQSQGRTDSLLAGILGSSTHPVLRQVTADPLKYRLQVIYTQINRDAKNKPSFTHYHFNYDPKLYFNPASMVKLPLAFLSLEKLNRLGRKEVNRNTAMVFDSSQPPHRSLYKDTTAASGKATIAHFIKRAFLISENDPYNRMYQWVGQQDINRWLHDKGYGDARITRQFLGLTAEGNRSTPAVRFLDKSGATIYEQPPAVNRDSFDFSQVIKLGKAHLDRNDQLISKPFDFTEHNNLSLGSLQGMLQSVLFPLSVSPQRRFNLTLDDYRFLYQYLSQYPSETPDPKYDTSIFYDSYVKFFFRDSTRNMPPAVRVFNKVGWSYGFLTDVSYVADFKNGVEYMLAATLYVNSDEVLNDGKYDYDTVGYPFLYQLGQTIYSYELQRKRAYKPDLSQFKMNYERRDPRDARPSMREVDN